MYDYEATWAYNRRSTAVRRSVEGQETPQIRAGSTVSHYAY
jgi:hypothetical protein